MPVGSGEKNELLICSPLGTQSLLEGFLRALSALRGEVVRQAHPILYFVPLRYVVFFQIAGNATAGVTTVKHGGFS
jgi:hypothetical protein